MPLAAFPKCFLDELSSSRMTVEQWIDLALQIDVDGLEFYWGFLPHDDPAACERLRAQVEAQGRTIPMLCYSSDFTWPDPQRRAEEVKMQQKAIRVAALLGARFCRVLSGQRRPGIDREAALQAVRDCILEALPVAEEVGVTLVLENHYKDGAWQYPEFFQRMDDFLAVLEQIPDCEAFGVNYDPSNAVIAGDDPLALLQAVKDRVRTMHASDRFLEGGTLADLRRIEADAQTGYASILRHGVIGRGLIEYDRIFTILREVQFRGWISIEDGPDPGTGLEDLISSAEFLRMKMRRHNLA